MNMNFICPMISFLIKALKELEEENDGNEYLFMGHVYGRCNGERVRMMFKFVTS